MTTQRLTDLKNKHPGARCCIVGMGPTLLDITAAAFTATDIVVALNHAIIHLEPLGLTIPVYSLQKDGFCVTPQNVPLLVHDAEAHETNSPDYEPRYAFTNETDFAPLEWLRPSVVTALKIAEMFGCPRVKLFACDALSTGDVRRVHFEQVWQSRIEPGSPCYTAPTDKLTELAAAIPLEIDWNKPPATPPEPSP